MRFTIVGGDLRSVYLCRRLLQDGHECLTFGLEQSDIPTEQKASSLADALQDTQCVVLPIPTANGSLLRAPYSTCPPSLELLKQALPPNTPVFGGGSCTIPMVDLTKVEPMTIGNSALTARAALQLITEHTSRGFQDLQVLILGGGRIGTLLGLELKNHGALVTILSRRRDCRVWHTAMGMNAHGMSELSDYLPQQDVIVNTVPAPILEQSTLTLIDPHALLLELASLPGGFDPKQAEALGIRTLIGRGLPGIYTPSEAADLIAETIYQELELCL